MARRLIHGGMSTPRRSLLRFLAYVAAFTTIGLAYWLRRTFGDVPVDQALWHLRFAERAALEMSSVLMLEFCVEVVVLPCIAAGVTTSAHGLLAPRLPPRRRALLRAIPVAGWASAVVALMLQFSFFSYAAAHFEPDHFAENYVDPQGVTLTVGPQRRNLILIYVESLEQAYGDAELFGRDLLAPLRRLGGHSFPSYRPVPGTTWTIASMVATQCGVPLKVYAESDLDQTGAGKVFLPGATCLGDVLQAHGYRNVFLGGASLSFAGKGTFLRDHGYAEAWGRKEWERSPLAVRDRNAAWGLYDNKLLENARLKLAELHAAGQPFNLTILTLDTHNPFGFLSPTCREAGVVDFKGIVTCSAEHIARFVEFAQTQGYLKNTVVVIIGDHLTARNPLWEQLQQVGSSRRMFNLILAEDGPQPNTQELLPYDMFPTVLELVGLGVKGDRMGLGYSAVGPMETSRPAQRIPLLARTAWERASPTYESLWKPTPE